MDKYLCIHGHFYQPPREDPWQGRILPEGSAAPMRHWNERICRESYAPMAFARRMDGQGRITDLVNVYEWISFNFGPTLISWLARSAPETYQRVVEADRKSAARWGRGNALAQVYHHMIMPLASDLDKELETAWAVQDFQARFGRVPDGMWLAETAVDTPSLEALAAAGVRFTILAPSQALAVSGDDGQWRQVDGWSLDKSRPYAVELPSGRSMAVFFYDGPLSQAVAFERLLTDGEQFWRRMSGACRPGILSLATDGETYGHHFKFGEMALAYALDQGREGRDGVRLTNFAAYLDQCPPTAIVRLREPSAWSCAHGVERWRSDCGCTDGGHPGWSQAWRAPLRAALDGLKERLDNHYFDVGRILFRDARAAARDYGRVLAGTESPGDFEARLFSPDLSGQDKARVWKLLSMQQWKLAAQASCAWFFDEISRIEPVNAMTYALRAMDLARATGLADPGEDFAAVLQKAVSNIPEMGTGRDVLENLAMPRRETPRTLMAQAFLTLSCREDMPGVGGSASVDWPGVSVSVAVDGFAEGEFTGRAEILWAHETAPETLAFHYWPAPGRDHYDACATVKGGNGDMEEGFCFREIALPVNKRQAVADVWAATREAALWGTALDDARSGARLLTELQEAQTTLTLAPLWAPLWAGLAWEYVWGLELPAKRKELLLEYLRWAGRDNPLRDALNDRLVKRACDLVSGPDPDFAPVAEAARRAAEIGLYPVWWPLQNLLWTTGLYQSKGREAAREVGFAV